MPQSKSELEEIKKMLVRLGNEYAGIFATPLLVLSDQELINSVKEKITSEQVNAEFALKFL
ncbi:phosphoenolpyruvate-utilizing N-terminal domain-containing protein [Halalkalibacter alkalisediminis]|uniref:Phosphoenolpyruvate-utilizing N-terminal domain-containing protein n=1 Tax=Halalkalibacter alkalisediminis TaxID=935616 RepID=A0ABV6NJD9_9BACI|nr:phosphoenolpyruvate-utilizing N-terminal domain-containing protein [Halalkalibacter alkalisediminis]